MAHDVHAVERAGDGVRVGDVAEHECDARVDLRIAAVHVGAQRVEHAHAPALLERRLHDGAADEAGASRDEEDPVAHERAPVVVLAPVTGRASTDSTAPGSISGRPR